MLFCSSLTFGQLSENFESDITARGWSLYQTDDSDPGFVMTTSQYQNGSASYYHDDVGVTNESTSYMVSPMYNVQADDALSVYVRQNYSTSYYNYSGIAISTSSADPIANPTAFTEIWEAGAGFAEDIWTQVSIALDTYVGQDIYIAFVYTGDYDHEFYVDNLYVGAACTAPEATATVVPACDSNQFSLDIEVTSLGTASSVTVSDDQGNSQTISTASTVSFGPYASGTNVTYTVADASNSACNMAGTATHLCPPSNDDCSGATVIDTFPHNSSEDGTGATQTDFVACGSSSTNDGVWYTFTAASAEYTINMTSQDWDSAMQIFSGSCDAMTCIATVDNAISNVAETYTFIAEAGVTYYINVARYSDSEDLPEGPFTLEILEEDIPCDAPTNLVTSETTDLSTEVSWQGATGNATYDLVWGETGFTPGADANVSGRVSTTYLISGLTPETTYDVYVRGNCDPGTSDWFGPVTFTTLAAGDILAGTDCIHPISVDTLPYTTTDDTSSYGDDYSGGQGSNCAGGQYYLNGDDVVYAYTATADTSLKVTLDPTATYAGIFIYENCADIGTSCVESATNSSSTDVLEIPQLVVTNGQTYYIVISTWASPQSTGYDLSITENTCTSGDYTLNAVGACDTDQFNVELDLTDMGTLTQYTISDDQGGAAQTITEPGVLTFGPYESGTSVSFTFEADDTNCNDTASILYNCPAVNDECGNAIEIPISPDYTCSEAVSGTTLGATASPPEDGADIVGTPNNDVWFSFVAASTTHRISLSNIVNVDGGSITDMAMAVYDATGGCDALAFVDDSDPNSFTISGLSIGTEYLIRVYNWSTTISNNSFDICVAMPPEAPANDECEGAIDVPVNADLTCTEVASGTTLGATASPHEDDVVGTPNNDVWFSFVAASTVHQITLSNIVNVGGSTSTDMAMGVYDASNGCDALVFVDDSDPNTLDVTGLTIGTEYLIRVHNWSSVVYDHTFDVCVGTPPPPPANDVCTGAIPIACGETIEGDTAFSTPSGLPSTCGSYTSSDARDLFYSFEADGTSDYLISLNPLSGYGFDGVLFVYSGECGELTSLGCSDSGNPEQVELTSPPAGTYYIRLFDYSGTEEFSLELECTENTCAPGTFELITQGSCDTNEFSVDIDITSLGTLDSYIITDDQGSTAQTITEPGTYTFGPYSASEVATEVSFTFEASDPNCSSEEVVSFRCAGPGETCDNPLMVDTLPYTTTDNTGNYSDDYDGAGLTCDPSASYINGDDVVYAFTPESDTTINITMTTGATWTGLLIYDNCEDIGNACPMDAVRNTGSGGVSLENYDVTAGTTYYMVLSSWPSPQSYDYDLTITENSCTSAEYTIETIGECETGEYTVSIDVTSLGSSTSLTFSDDQGSSEQTLDAPGVLTFGPYTAGTSVLFSLVTDDENCNDSATVSYSCPPVNDDVCNAIPLTVGATSAGDAYTTESATAETGETIGSCLSTYGDLETVWFSFEAPASGNVTVTTDIAGGTLNDTQLAIYEAPTDCSDISTLGAEVGCDQDSGGENGHNYRSIAIMTGLVAGNTYYIQIDGWGTATGTFGIEVYDTDDMSVDDVASKDNVKLYPNPTSSELFISGIELKDAQVYNMSGKLIPVKTRDNMVDTKQLPTGTYIIRMIDLEGNVILRKFIKK